MQSRGESEVPCPKMRGVLPAGAARGAYVLGVPGPSERQPAVVSSLCSTREACVGTRSTGAG